MQADDTKTITAYTEPLSLRAGGTIQLMASCLEPGPVELDLVRIICGDPTRTGPGFREQAVGSALPPTVTLQTQALIPGSYGEVDLRGLTLAHELALDVCLQPTRPQVAQTVLMLADARGAGIALRIADARLLLEIDGVTTAFGPDRLLAGRWYEVAIRLACGAPGQIRTGVTTLPTRSPGSDYAAALGAAMDRGDSAPRAGDIAPRALDRCLLAASTHGARFDGRLAKLRLAVDEHRLSWDFARGIDGRRLIDTGEEGRHGLLFQCPARGVTGPDWDGSAHAWTVRPEHYDAIHFHSDDLNDAGWPVTASLELAADLPSGIYAFRLRRGSEVDRVPFFVRPHVSAATAAVALLMPTCTYLAYANHRMLFEGADFVAARQRLRPEHEYVRAHPEVGPSLYEKHSDGSGVMYSSRRRPILQLRPGADGWNFTPDTDINAFLDWLDVGHDVLSDEDLHGDGLAALAPYRVIVTGSHPEYWSTRMLDALEAYVRGGGRLIYLGGNGFYWRIAFSEAWPGTIELRRAEDGVRNWQTPSGESYHSFNGEYGGLWRRLGRPPNALVGVGFVAQGFERAVAYERSAASYDSRAAWIFAGVDGQAIGTSGLGGGAAGQEVDSYNPALGSPPHALVLASATDFCADMTRTKEELDAAIIVPSPDPVVRADVVFFETGGGGAVFSVGSIAWFGALARDRFDNDVARITANVVRRFLAPAPFAEPDGD